MDFFSACSTQEEAKATFRTLSKHFHPDKGGDIKLMLELRKQYDEFPKRNVEIMKPNKYGKEVKTYYYESTHSTELTKLKHEIQGMAITIINLKTEKIRANQLLEEVKYMNFLGRLCFFLFGVKYFNSFFYSNFNGQP